jgi:hypothetical protein
VPLQREEWSEITSILTGVMQTPVAGRAVVPLVLNWVMAVKIGVVIIKYLSPGSWLSDNDALLQLMLKYALQPRSSFSIKQPI